MEIETSRLILHAVDEAAARRIRARAPGPGDRWAPDYPFDGDLVALGAFLHANEQRGEQRPFGYYQIVTAADRFAVGGVGFKGPPVDGRVEVGYGLVPSARGHGYAAEALAALLILAAGHRVTTVAADTAADNVASQRTLIRAGFAFVRADDHLHHYELSRA